MTDPNAPATKQDVALLMEHIGKLYEANERWKDEIVADVDGRITASEHQIKAHFDVVAENIQHDFQHGVIPDLLSQHEDRMRRLERRIGTNPAT